MVAVTKNNVERLFGEAAQPSHGCVMMYHMHGCPHCVMMRPNWDAAMKSTGKGVRVLEIEYADMSILPRALQNVRGFPTIMAIRDNRPYAEYTGDRSTESLRDFILRHAAPPAAPAATAKKPRPASAPAPATTKKRRATPAAPKKKPAMA